MTGCHEGLEEGRIGEGWGANRKQKGREGAGDWEEVRGRERQRGPHGAEKNEGVEGTAETGWMGG